MQVATAASRLPGADGLALLPTASENSIVPNGEGLGAQSEANGCRGLRVIRVLGELMEKSCRAAQVLKHVGKSPNMVRGLGQICDPAETQSTHVETPCCGALRPGHVNGTEAERAWIAGSSL